jgi:hypothetical protein
MWELILMVVPQLLKLVIWNVDKRTQTEANFREWVSKRQNQAPLHVEEKESYDAQVEELTKESTNEKNMGVDSKPVQPEEGSPGSNRSP